MDLKQIKELMAAMEKAGLKRIRIKEKDKYEIELERQMRLRLILLLSLLFMRPILKCILSFPFTVPTFHKEHVTEDKIEDKQVEGKFITAPLVGTIYHAASPEDSPFVKVGDRVDENTVVCIIEAMKVMNEVKAGISGTIAEIFVENAHPVEFGAKLFRII